jgi:hypothetical protein
MSQPAYPGSQPLASLILMLQQSTATPYHTLWPDDISLLDAERFHHAHLHGPRQLTDLYLLGLAVKNKACLVSFDARIPLSAVHGASAKHLINL